MAGIIIVDIIVAIVVAIVAGTDDILAILCVTLQVVRIVVEEVVGSLIAIVLVTVESICGFIVYRSVDHIGDLNDEEGIDVGEQAEGGSNDEEVEDRRATALGSNPIAAKIRGFSLIIDLELFTIHLQ